MKVEVQWKKLVKPSAPTPSDRQKLKLTSLDKLNPPKYVGIVFFYKDNAEKPAVDISGELHQMEDSLSKVLTLFHPMAGRYSEEDGSFIDCNDLGVEFVHAKVDGQINEVLHGGPDMDFLHCLSEFPSNIVGNPLVVIQVSIFECGGLAIAVRFAHKLGDMYTMAMFINSWATVCRGNVEATVCPSFELSSLFPVKELEVRDSRPLPVGNGEFVMKRFGFSSNSILKLKALARDDANDLMGNDFRPSRVEVVSALIGRALIDIDRKKHGKQKTSVVCMPLNLREKTNLAIPTNSCGNFCTMIAVRSDRLTDSKSKLKFSGMVDAIRGMISNAKMKFSTVVDWEQFCLTLGNSVTDFYKTMSVSEVCLIPFSSWCRFGLNEMDFGWGRPILVSSTSPNYRLIVLIDDEDSGAINAWTTIEKDELTLLEQDPEILAFASWL